MRKTIQAPSVSANLLGTLFFGRCPGPVLSAALRTRRPAYAETLIDSSGAFFYEHQVCPPPSRFDPGCQSN